ncbi:MAG TPA: ATP-binding SpoIIE family protein phosphatase, partial [Acetobacteraceae bacterium]
LRRAVVPWLSWHDGNKVLVSVTDTSQIAEARRLACSCARRLGLSETRTGQVALVVTELATNILKHGGGGEILTSRFDDRDGAGLEVLALDRGRGMADVERCLQDGYSTAGTPGNGLGAVIRQADQVRIWSSPDHGTAIVARFVARASATPGKTQLGAATAPFPGESTNGDGWSFASAVLGHTLLMIDGSGHGIEAARAAQCATELFREHVEDACEHLMQRLHRALAPTRGGAVAIARIDAAARTVRYVGVGNISGTLIDNGSIRHMVSHNGTAGHIAPRIREFTYGFTTDPLVILHSDGVTTRWDLGSYPGLAAQHPSLIAGVLLRDHRRGRDDATVVAMRAVL